MAITAAQQTSILKIVAGLFNAAPGATYLTSFANYMALPGATSLGLANALAADAAFTNGVMGGQVTVAAQVAKLMANFGLTYAAAPVAGTADGDAQAFFTGQINAGVGFGQIVDSAVTFLDGISAKQAAGTALTAAETIYATTAQTLQNKALVAEHYSATLGTASGTLASLQTVLSGVTATTFPAGATAATVTVAQLNAALAAGGGVAGTSFALTGGVDAIVGSANNDTISATDITWTALDTIDGGAGSDTLNILDTAGGLTTAAAGVAVTNVETANIRSVAGVTVDASAWTGLTALNVTQSNGVNTITAANTTVVTVTDTAGAVTVNGGSTVTITDGAGAVAVNSATTGAITAVTVTGGTVTTIADANATADTIATVSLTSIGGTAIIGTDALTTLNLTTSAFGATVTAAAAARALTLNMNGNTAGTVTDNTATTLNINNTGAATTGVTVSATSATTVAINATTALTLAALTGAAPTTTAVSIAGAGATTITANTLAANAVITSTSTGGVTLTQALAAGQQFAGAASSGNDSISVATGSTVANNLGAGNNTAILAGAMGVGGTLTAGAGTADILVLSAAAFALTGVTGFETLALTGAATGAYTATGFTSVAADTVAAGATFNSVAANAALALTGASGTIVYNLANSAGTTDILNLSIAAAATGANAVTAAGIETVNITASNSTAVAIVETLTLSAAAATTVNVSGGALTSVVLVNTDTTITSLNASAVAGGNFTWTTGILAAASTITGSATGINTVNFDAAATAATSVTYVGGAGNDVISGINGLANTVTLGNGTNSYTHAASAGIQTVTGGTGVDTIIGGTANDVIVGGGGADIITGGAGADKITVVGTGVSIVQGVGASGANTSTTIQTSELTSTFDVIYGAVAGDLITTGNTAIVTGANLTTAATNLAGGLDSTAFFARGTYDGVNGTFTYGAAGLDSVLTYDSTTAIGGGANITNESIVLVGFVSGASTAVAGVITLV